MNLPAHKCGLRLAAGFLLALAMIAFTAASLIHDPPLAPPQVSYLGHDQVNP